MGTYQSRMVQAFKPGESPVGSQPYDMQCWLLMNRFAWGFLLKSMRQSAPSAVLISLAPFWAALAHTGAFASVLGWLSVVLPRWVLVFATERKNLIAGCTASVSKVWAIVGVELASLNVKLSQLAWRKEYYHLGCPQRRKGVSALKFSLNPALPFHLHGVWPSEELLSWKPKVDGNKGWVKGPLR